MKMKLKKTLRAVSAAAVGAGAIMVLGLAGQSLALAQSAEEADVNGSLNNFASDTASFNGDIAALCAIPLASQPFFGGDASDPSWNCGGDGRTYP